MSKEHLCVGHEAKRLGNGLLKHAFLKFSEVIALMIEGQGALLRSDQEEARGKAASAALILNEPCTAADPI